jgi:hypothetical protein
MEMHSWAAKYIRSFALFEKTARVDFLQFYQQGRWTGLLNGVPKRSNEAAGTTPICDSQSTCMVLRH